MSTYEWIENIKQGLTDAAEIERVTGVIGCRRAIENRSYGAIF